MSAWNNLLTIRDKVSDTFKSGGGSESFTKLLEAAKALENSLTVASGRSFKSGDSFSKFQEIKTKLGKLINTIN